MKSHERGHPRRRPRLLAAPGLVLLLAAVAWGATAAPVLAGIGAKAALESQAASEEIQGRLVAAGQPLESFWRGGILYLVLDSRDPGYLQEVADLAAWLASLGIECLLIDRADLAAFFTPVYWDAGFWDSSWWWYYPWWTNDFCGWWPYPPGNPEPPPEKPRLRPYEPPGTAMPWQWIAARPEPVGGGPAGVSRVASIGPSSAGETRGSPAGGGSSSGGFSGGGHSSPSPSSGGGGSPSSDRGGKQ